MNKKNFWIVEGLIFGIIMLAYTTIIDLVSDDFTLKHFLIKIPIWLLGGLLYGLIMKFVRNRLKDK